MTIIATPTKKSLKKPLDYHLNNIDIFYSLSERDVISLKRYVNGMTGRYELIVESNKIKFDYKMKNRDYILPLDEITTYACNLFGIDKNVLMSRDKSDKLPDMRAFIYKLANSEFRHSKIGIGRFFDRDHSSVIHGIKRITDIIDTEPTARHTYEELIKFVKGSANNENGESIL
jgi:chromosomal replication initiation ATPase DnaA